MRRQAALLMTFALLAGGLAAFLASRMVGSDGPPVEGVDGAPRMVRVAVADRDMNVGTLLRHEDLRLVEWPADRVPAGYTAAPDEIVGRGLLTPVKVNEPLLSGKLANPEAGGGMHIMIPEGKRAMSVRVDDVVGVAGFVLPGTRVDVVVTMDGRVQGGGDAATEVVLQNLEVVSAGQSIERNPDGEPELVAVVTLLVDPDEAEKLAMGHSNGRLQLALRNPLDLDRVETSGILASRLVGARPAPRPVRAASAPAAPPPPPRHLEVYRGTQRTTSTPGSGPGAGGAP